MTPMRPLAPRLEQLAESSTIAMSRRAAALSAAGIDVSPLAAGEPAFDTPPHVIEAMVTAARAGATRYPPVLGLPELRIAIAEFHTRRYRVPISASRIAVTPGAKFALWATFQALLRPGDEVLLPAPSWVSYAPQIQLADGVVVALTSSPESGWRLDLDQLESALTARTTAIVLCSPNNPTGICLTEGAASRLGDLALAHDLWLVCDDLYAELVFGEKGFVSPLTARPELLDRTLIVDGLSKSHAMTGWRLGYLDAPPPVVDLVGRLLSQTLTGTTTFVQHGGLAALRTPSDLDPIRSAYAHRASRLTAALRALGLPTVAPEGGFCLMTDVRHHLAPGESSDTLALRLLEEAHVATVAGEAFGAPGFLRMSFACSDLALDLAIARLGGFFGRHQGA